MRIRRRIIKLLDRRGARFLLSAVANRITRKRSPGSLIYFRDGMWVHQIDGVAFFDSPGFEYNQYTFRSWSCHDTSDCWFHAYRPSAGEVVIDKGMQRTLALTRALCISCHDFRADKGEGEFFRTKQQVLDAVKAAGFTIVPRDSDQRRWISDQVNGIRP